MVLGEWGLELLKGGSPGLRARSSQGREGGGRGHAVHQQDAGRELKVGGERGVDPPVAGKGVQREMTPVEATARGSGRRLASPSTNASTLVRPSWRRDSLAVYH